MTPDHQLPCPITRLIDLHIHLDGAISLATAKELLRLEGKTVPSDDELKAHIQVQEACTSLSAFLEKFSFLYPFIQTKEALKVMTANLLSELQDEGLIYAEIRFAPLLCCERGLTQMEVLKTVLEAAKKSTLRHNFVLCMMREASLEKNLETLELTRKYLGKGVVALDLAGAEDAFNDRDFSVLFQLARQNHLPITVHAGEAGPPQNVWKALEWGAQVIGHGTHSFKDPALEDYLAAHRIPLTMCPTSNVQTGVAPRIEDLPIRRYMEKGIPLTINTDDPGVEGITLRQEWERLIQALSLTKAEIRRLMLNSVDAAFCGQDLKAQLRREMEEAYPA